MPPEVPAEPKPAGGLLLRLHGAAVALREAHAPVRLERKQAALLALVWLGLEGDQGGGGIARARVAELLWPDVESKRARGNLRERLASLRASLGELVRDEQGLLTLAGGVHAQADAFEGGGLLGAFDYTDCDDFLLWLNERREASRATHQATMLAAVREAARQGGLDRAEQLAQGLLALDRESEEAYRVLMEVYYLRGEYAAAIAVWDRCREMLRQLYGVLPGEATRRLGERLLRAARDPQPQRMDAAQTLPVTVLRPPRLVGREAALGRLQAAWGSGAVVCVGGVAGIGKSRLLAEFAAWTGPLVMTAARPGDELLPYSTLARWVTTALDRFEPALASDVVLRLAALLPTVVARLAAVSGSDFTAPPAPHAGHELQRAYGALHALLLACVARGCVGWGLDDLHFADLASVQALGAVLDLSELHAVLGTRSEEQTAQGAALLAQLAASSRLAPIELAALSAAEVAELVDSLDLQALAGAPGAHSLPARVHHQVGGNPAFVLETLKLLLALGPQRLARLQGDGASTELPLPSGIEAVLERRVTLLSPRARHVAQMAAIARAGFSLPLAAQALACVPIELAEPMQELEQRQIFYGRNFVHELVAGAVLRSIPTAVAQFMHRFVAEHLERENAEPALIAPHWAAVGDAHRAAHSYRAAAAVAHRAHRPIEQAQLLASAEAHFAQAGAHDERFDTLIDQLQIWDTTDQAAQRHARLDTLEALARTEAQRLRALVQRLSWRATHSQAGRGVTDQGLDGVRRAWAIARPDLAFTFVPPLAWQLAMAGDDAAAVALVEQHRDWVHASADAATRAQFHVALTGIHGFNNRLQPAIEHAHAAITWHRAADNPSGVLAMQANIGLYRLWRGELELASAVLSEAQALRDRMQGGGSSLIIDVNLACVQRDQGHYAQAAALLEHVLAQYRSVASAAGEPPTDRVVAENHLASVWLMSGELDAAQALLSGDDDGVDLRFRARRMALQLRLLRRRGSAAAATAYATLWPIARAAANALLPGFHRALTELELASTLPAREAAAEFARLCDAPPVRERPGMRLHAALKAAEASARIGQSDNVRAFLTQAQHLAQLAAPFDLRPEDVMALTSAAQASLVSPAEARTRPPHIGGGP